ncbi:MAG: hypothetical protein ACI9G9_000545 [Psychromonas sp.]|jgi:hypothetical protein
MKKAAFLLAILISFSSCDFKSKRYASTGTAVTGRIGEILVVCDKDLWEGELKACLDSNLTQFIMPYFPDVATFELIHKTPKHFTQGVKRYRNALFLNVDQDFKGERGEITKRMGVWATDQLVVEVTANSYNQLVETCQQGLPTVHEEFDRIEWERILKYYSFQPNIAIDRRLKSSFGIKVALPDGAKVVTSRKNFYRVEFPTAARPISFVGSGKEDMGTIFSGLMIYQYDYKDTSQLELSSLLSARDTMLKYNVPYSTIEGMYMGTQYVKMVYPEMNKGKNASEKLSGIEMRGMFKFLGKKQFGPGGAFWAFHFINPKTKKLICVSGYVDAPSTASWTQPLREVQAILKSIEIL